MSDLHKKNKVLVVDDDQAVRTLISATLIRHGYEVTMAKNGRIGVEHVQAAPDQFDLILLDCQMPVMDGPTACRVMHECAPDAPVVLMSTQSKPPELDKIGACEFFEKPFVPSDLITLVSRHISN